MKMFKNLIAFLVLLGLMPGLTSCSDNSWCIKTQDTSVPIGVYIYYMSESYSKAYGKVENPSEDILSQNIDDKSAADYIRDDAVLSCKKLIALENMFTDLGLSLTEEENKSAAYTTSKTWDSYGKTYENLGIAKDSFQRAAVLYNLKYPKVLEFKFGENGTDKIESDEIKDHFTNKYTSYSCFSKDLSSENPTEENSDVTEPITKDFELFANKINDKSSYDSVFKEFKSKYLASDDVNISSIEDLNKTNKNSLPEDVIKSLDKLDNQKAINFQSLNGKIYLLYKHDITSKVSFLDTETNKEQVKKEVSVDKLDSILEDFANKLDAQINEKTIKKYPPSIIENHFKKSK